MSFHLSPVGVVVGVVLLGLAILGSLFVGYCVVGRRRDRRADGEYGERHEPTDALPTSRDLPELRRVRRVR
jgi:hypothetical protein